MTSHSSVQSGKAFHKDALHLDAALECERIARQLTETVTQKFRRAGAVVGLSGGIDSSVVLALCARAFGAERVLGLILPERESSPISRVLALQLADQFGVRTLTEEITPILDAYGCYRRRDEAIRRVIPEYQTGWDVKIVLPGGLLEYGTLNVFSLVVAGPDGVERRKRLPVKEYKQIVAASNIKQRVRTNLLYFHAEALNYAVVGTPNKNEHELGFFVKWGDGGYDIAPLRHLYKTQVYQLGDYLQIPPAIMARVPTTDTYPGASPQEEFFFRIPVQLLDVIWFGIENGVPVQQIAEELSLPEVQIQHVIDDIARKQSSTVYMRASPLGFETEGQSQPADG